MTNKPGVSAEDEVKDRAAIESACRFIEQNIAPRKCDSAAVSGCWRCNSAYLAKRVRELINAPDLQGRAQPAQAEPQPVAVRETIPDYVELYKRMYPEDQAAQKAVVNDWRIDTSAGRQILVYKDCSVIEAEQAHYVMGLIAVDQARKVENYRDI